MAKRFGVFAALAIVAGLVGCGSSSDTPATTPKDTGVKTDAPPSDGNTSDTGVTPGEVDIPTPGTTGKACTDDATCDPAGDYGSRCIQFTKTASTCAGGEADCTATTDTDQFQPCDKGLGYCEFIQTSGLCIGGCDFNLDGTYVAGRTCPAGIACVSSGYIALNSDMTWKSGIGTCEGGTCKTDAECPASTPKCQVEQLGCVAAANFKTYSKKQGDACTRPASGASSDCLCWAEAGKQGYCAAVCTVGGGQCGAGMFCSALLSSKTDSGAAGFTKQPDGMQGYCLKPCASDADCSSIAGGAYCETSTTGGGFCEPGVKPAAG